MAKRKHTATDTDYKVVSDGLQPRDMWRTPEPILVCVRNLFGGEIICDPCTDAANPTRAKYFGTPERPLHDRWIPPIVPEGAPEQWTELFQNHPFSTRNVWTAWFAALVLRGVLLTPYETAPAFRYAREQGWHLIRPKSRIAYDTPPMPGVVNEKRPTGPTVLFAKGYTFKEVRDAFPRPAYTVWRCTDA